MLSQHYLTKTTSLDSLRGLEVEYNTIFNKPRAYMILGCSVIAGVTVCAGIRFDSGWSTCQPHICTHLSSYPAGLLGRSQYCGGTVKLDWY